ncbi:MAG: homocysteine S-methyltransferase family protein [Acidobacteria bacterium]|nr:homocysteine S-methyltransferase family protein [Acidobacteriota bacterium]
MSGLAEWLKDGPLLTDGAWGTQLQALGLELGQSPDFWNIEFPERVEQVARGYVEAGSQIILTNTFRSNAIALEGADIARLNRQGVAISRRAAAGRCRVVASIGPVGKMLFSGEVSAEQVAAAFVEQIAGLVAAGPDALLLETMSDIEEARIGVESARATGLPVIVSFTFDTGRNRDRTMMGATPEQVASAMQEAGADAVGANCGQGIEHFLPLCRRLRAACSLPIWIKPNAGMPEVTPEGVVYRTVPDWFASHAPALLKAGASFLGGCCGTSPEFIRALASGAGEWRACATS